MDSFAFSELPEYLIICSPHAFYVSETKAGNTIDREVTKLKRKLQGDEPSEPRSDIAPKMWRLQEAVDRLREERNFYRHKCEDLNRKRTDPGGEPEAAC